MNITKLLHFFTDIDEFITAGSVITITAANSDASFLTPNQGVFTPTSIWNNGKVYIPFAKRIDQNPYGQIGIFVYDERVGMDRPKVVGKSWPVGIGGDTHVIPIVGVNAAGHIYCMQQQPNSYIIDNYKSQAPDDWEDFAEVAADVATTMMYVNLLKKADGNYAIWNRRTVDYHAGIAVSTAELETWGTNTQVTNRTIANTRHYITTPSNPKVGTWFYTQITRRFDTSLNWVDYFILKTQDFATFFNWEGTTSATLPTLTADASLDANFVFFNGLDTEQHCTPVSCMSPQGSFFCVIKDDAGDHILIRRNLADTAWENIAITIPDLADMASIGSDPQGSAAMEIVAYSDSNIELICRVDEGAFSRPQRWKTIDRGDTWEFIESPFSTINDNFHMVSYPRNILDIPNDRNFVLIASGYSGAASSNVYLKRAAFGAVQPEPGYTPPAITILDDIPDLLIEYEMTPSKMTVTGSVVNTLLDQSGNGRNANTAGSPLHNGVDEITWDGVNDRADLPGSGIITLNKGTIIGVVRAAVLNQAFQVCAFTDSTNVTNSEYIICGSGGGVAANSATFAYFNGANGFSVVGQKAILDTAYHIIAYVIGNNKVSLYIDGVYQYHTLFSGLFGTGILEAGKFCSSFTTINNITIGAMIRNTTTYLAFRMKHYALYGRCLTQDQRHAAEIMLAAKYSLPLDTNQYS